MKSVEGNDLEPFIKLKSLSKTRRACRWEAVKSIERQIFRIVAALIKISEAKGAHASVDAKSLQNAICNFRFILELHILKVIFSNTNALTVYLQNKKLDIATAKTTAEATVLTLKNCRNPDDFLLIWHRAKDVIGKLHQNSSVSGVIPAQAESYAGRPTQPSQRLQALVGECYVNTAGKQQRMNEVDLARIEVYYNGRDRVINEINERFNSSASAILVGLSDVVTNKYPEKNSFDVVADFYNLDVEDLKLEKNLFKNLEIEKNTDSDVITPCQIAWLMQSNGLHVSLPQFWKVVHVLASIPVTSSSAVRSFSCLRRLKTYLRNTMGGGRVSSLAVINIERHFTNKVDVNTVINIFGKQHGRAKYFF